MTTASIESNTADVVAVLTKAGLNRGAKIETLALDDGYLLITYVSIPRVEQPDPHAYDDVLRTLPWPDLRVECELGTTDLHFTVATPAGRPGWHLLRISADTSERIRFGDIRPGDQIQLPVIRFEDEDGVIPTLYPWGETRMVRTITFQTRGTAVIEWESKRDPASPNRAMNSVQPTHQIYGVRLISRFPTFASDAAAALRLLPPLVAQPPTA